MTCQYKDNLCQRKDQPSFVKGHYCNGDDFSRCSLHIELDQRLYNYLESNRLRVIGQDRITQID